MSPPRLAIDYNSPFSFADGYRKISDNFRGQYQQRFSEIDFELVASFLISDFEGETVDREGQELVVPL